MPTHHALTETERKVALWVARGKTPPTIAAELGITPATLRVHLSHIRSKTSLPDLAPSKLASYLQRHAIASPAEVRNEVTGTQRAVLLMVVAGKSVDDIATTMGIRKGTAMNHASLGCKRLGITVQGWARRQAIIDALVKIDPMNDPYFQP